MLTQRESERLEQYYPLITFWMKFHLLFWSSITLAAVSLVVIFLILGEAQASIPGWVILALAVLGVGILPIYLFFRQKKRRKAFRDRVVAVGPQVIYRLEGYDLRMETVLLSDIIRPLAKKNLLDLVAGMLSPVIETLPEIPPWVSITFSAKPFVEMIWNKKAVKARGLCLEHKHLLISNPGSLESMQALLLHEVAHAILVENFPGLERPEQERIIRESHIEKTDLLGLT